MGFIHNKIKKGICISTLLIALSSLVHISYASTLSQEVGDTTSEAVPINGFITQRLGLISDSGLSGQIQEVTLKVQYHNWTSIYIDQLEFSFAQSTNYDGTGGIGAIADCWVGSDRLGYNNQTAFNFADDSVQELTFYCRQDNAIDLNPAKYLQGFYIQNPVNQSLLVYGSATDSYSNGQIFHDAPGGGISNPDANINDAYFIVEAIDSPTLSSISQLKSDQSTPISETSTPTITETNPYFKAIVTDPASYQVKLQVEIRKTSDAFTAANDSGMLTSSLVSSGSQIALNKSGLEDGSYHWRYRGINSYGVASAWTEFGTAGNTDFTVHQVPLYTQVVSSHPSLSATGTWTGQTYGDRGGTGAYADYKFTLTNSDTYSVSVNGKDVSAPNGRRATVKIKVFNESNNKPSGLALIEKEISWPYGDNQYKDITTSLGSLGSGSYIIRIISTKYYADPSDSTGNSDLNAYLKQVRIYNPSNSYNNSIAATSFIAQKGTKTIGGDTVNLYAYECGSTIRECGCYITSIVMMLHYLGISEDVNNDLITPKTLNDWVVDDKGYGMGGDLNDIDKTVRGYTKDSNGLPRTYLQARKDYAVSGPLSDLNTYVDNGTPVIISAKSKSHFLVVSDKLTSTYSTRDPWWYNTKKLTQTVNDAITETNYDNTFNGFRVLAVSENNNMGDFITFSIASPAELLITDPDGLRLGKNPTTNTDYNEITDGGYFEETIKAPDDDTPINHYTKKIYIPNAKTGDYTVKVIGTGTGSYTLTNSASDDNYDNHTEVFEGNTSTDVTTEYTLNYDPLEPNDIEITPNDTTAPVTTISLSGTTGTSGWYTSNVQVTLSSTDNAGGVGIYKTEYSLDGGTNWITYSLPFTISNESSSNTVKYRSEDYVGNLETASTQTIKIDKTAPEAKISFDTATGFPKIEGSDNLSVATVAKINDQNYTITDDSGRTLKINLFPIQTAPILTNPAVLTMKINTLQYDSSPAITLPITTLVYKWLGSPLTLLTQNVTTLLQFVVTGVYNPVNNTTNIVTVQGGVPIIQTLSGVKIIKLTTQSGNLGFEF